MKNKRIAALFLSLLLAGSTMISCSDDITDTNEVPSGILQNSEVIPETEKELTLAEQRELLTNDDLPEVKYDGREFRFAHQTWALEYLYAEEINGEIVNDKTNEANMAVEERFDVKITPVILGEGDVAHGEALKRVITAGDDAFEIAFGHDMLTPTASLEGFFLNILDVPHLSFDQPWWPAEALRQFTVNGKCYMGLSSISYMSLARARVVYINEDLMESYQIELPYEDVINGTWTYDKLINLTKDFYQDADGDGVKSEADIYGYITEGGCYGYLENFGINTIEKDEIQILKVGFNPEKMIDVVEKTYSWLFESQGAKMTDDANAYGDAEFAQGRLLIGHFELTDMLNQVRETDINYGIVPMPKYDETQENYVTSCVEHPMVLAKTLTGEQLDFAGVITDAMAFENYKKVFPAYYEVALGKKYLNRDSVRMLEIINESASLSFSFVYDNGTGVNLCLYNLMCNPNPSADFASFYRSREKIYQRNIENIIKAFED